MRPKLTYFSKSIQTEPFEFERVVTVNIIGESPEKATHQNDSESEGEETKELEIDNQTERRSMTYRHKSLTDFKTTPVAIDIETDVDIKKLFDALDQVQHKEDDINLLQTESCDDQLEALDLTRLQKSPVKVKSVKVGTEVYTRDQSAQAYTLSGNQRVAER